MKHYRSIFSEDLSLVFLNIDNGTVEKIIKIIEETNYHNCYGYYLGDNDEFNFYLDDLSVSFLNNKIVLKKNKFNYLSIPLHKIDKVEYNANLDEGVMELFIKNKKNPIVINFIM